jgi:cytoskeletal protein CcmA (bactofilin family)
MGKEASTPGSSRTVCLVSCPKCKAEQEESVHVQSTVCRACGHYFRVPPASRKGLGSLISGWFQGLQPPRTSGLGTGGATGSARSSAPALRPAYAVEPFYGTEEYVAGPAEEIAEPSVADAVVEALEFESAEPDDLELVVVPGVGVGPSGAAVGPAVHPGALELAGERTVACLDCGTELQVSRSARSVLCRRCGCTVDLEDYDIREHRRESIRTRGGITIHRRASLTAGEIACDSLKVFGRISGQIQCSGDVMFRSSGKVVGALRCRHIVVHKLCNLKFQPGIRAETAEIHGHVEGDILCEGTIRISKTGAVFGDCIAPAVSLEDGATLAGRMRFTKPDRAIEEEYARKAAEAQRAYFQHELEAELAAQRAGEAEATPWPEPPEAARAVVPEPESEAEAVVRPGSR